MRKTTLPPPTLSPTPWAFDPQTRDVNDALGKGVAELYVSDDVHGSDSPVTRANGRLIAAAPHLLNLACSFHNVCRERLASLDDERDWRPKDEYDDMKANYSYLLKKCDEIIAKANASPPTPVAPALDLFGVCLKAHHLLFMHKEDAAAIPGFAELYDDIDAAIEDALGR